MKDVTKLNHANRDVRDETDTQSPKTQTVCSIKLICVFVSVISKCQPIPADALFVLDSSISQTRAQFRKQLEFVEMFVNATTLGPKNFTVGVITFSFDAHYEIKLNENLYNKTVSQGI